jgi:hypothetical protein
VDPVAAAEHAVLEAYRGMWAAYDAAGRAPEANPDDEGLATFATDDALQLLIDGLTSMREDGLVIDGAVDLNPVVVDLSPTGSPNEARIEDCGDSTKWLTVRLDTGEVTDDPRGRQLVIAQVRDVGSGVWKVVSFAVREVGSCG